MIFEVSRGAPERFEKLLEAFGAPLELSWELLRPLGALKALLEASWILLERSWGALGRSYSALRAENTPTRAPTPAD